jgi:hypothetical protein
MRPLALLLCLALAACVTDTGPDRTGSIAAPAAATAVPAMPGRHAQASAAKEEWWKQGGVTREKISAMCWMKHERGRANPSLDQRVELVERCIAETSQQYGVR